MRLARSEIRAYVPENMHTVKQSRGRVAFIVWMRAAERGQVTALSVRMGVQRPILYQWRDGLARPTPPQRTVLAAICGIHPDLWLTSEERRYVRKAIAA